MSLTRALQTTLALPAALVVASGGFVAGAGASTAASAASAGTSTFSDPAGDAQGGPDVTQVEISGSAATGAIELTVIARGFEPATSDERERDVLVWLDTDKNRSTGDPEDGTDYALQAWNDATGGWWNMIRWNGAEWESVPQSATMRVTAEGDSVTFAFASADLGGATTFRFYVIAGTWNVATESFDTRDEAPDVGWWSYDIASSAPTPKPRNEVSLGIRTPTTTPRSAVAGKPLTIRFPVEFFRMKTISVVDLETGQTREDLAVSWEPVPRGKYSATITVAGATLQRSGSFGRGELRLSLAVPKTAGGKLIRIAVKVTATDKETGKTLTAKRVATFRLR